MKHRIILIIFLLSIFGELLGENLFLEIAKEYALRLKDEKLTEESLSRINKKKETIVNSQHESILAKIGKGSNYYLGRICSKSDSEITEKLKKIEETKKGKNNTKEFEALLVNLLDEMFMEIKNQINNDSEMFWEDFRFGGAIYFYKDLLKVVYFATVNNCESITDEIRRRVSEFPDNIYKIDFFLYLSYLNKLKNMNDYSDNLQKALHVIKNSEDNAAKANLLLSHSLILVDCNETKLSIEFIEKSYSIYSNYSDGDELAKWRINYNRIAETYLKVDLTRGLNFIKKSKEIPKRNSLKRQKISAMYNSKRNKYSEKQKDILIKIDFLLELYRLYPALKKENVDRNVLDTILNFDSEEFH